MPAVHAQLWPPGNTHKGYERQPAPGLDLSASRKGIRLSPASVRRGLGPARLGAVIAPRRCRYRHIIRSNRLGLCHASRARKWRREPLISYPCGAATHRRTLEPALILGGQGAIRGRAGGGAGREGMIMIRRGILTITVAALPLLALTAIATAAAPNPWDTCYGACAARCAAQHSCHSRRASRNCFAHYNECKNLCRMSCPR